MKKILIALTIAMVAGFVQAASVDWKTSGVKIMSSDGKSVVNIGSSTAYTATCYFFAADGTTAVALGAAGTTDNVASMNTLAGTVSDKFSNNTTYYAQLVIKSDQWEVKSEKAAFTIGDVDATINFTNGAGFNAETAKIAYSTTSWQSTAAPEPTSGILLLLGMAGLALKRKRA